MIPDLARNAYRQIEVNGSNRLQLVVMLYEGAVRFLSEAKACGSKDNKRGRAIAINRAIAIVSELQSTLNVNEGGEIAQSLDRLYTYMTGRILDAKTKGNDHGIDESVKLLRVLNSAWTEIAAREHSEAALTDNTPAMNTPSEPLSRGPLELFL